MTSHHNRTALVLGANGYIGQNLCWWLLNQGFTVSAAGLEPHWKGHADTTGRLSYQCLDLSVKEEVMQLSFHTDLVFMMAGVTGTSAGFSQYPLMVLSNEMALLHVLHAMTEQQSRARLVFPSTRLVYQGQRGKMLPEDAPKETKTVYAANKLACEGYLAAWANAFDLNYTVYRICVPYGHLLPGQYSFGTLGFMRRQAREQAKITLYGDGSMGRTFTHVKDICRIMTEASMLSESNGRILNIGSHDHMSLKQLADMVCRQTGAELAFLPWPALDERIESGDTMFSDLALQSIMPYSYEHRIQEYIAGWQTI
jgi:UDP-glucose 4-epimerase